MADAPPTARQRLMAQIRRRRSWRWALRTLYGLVLVAVFANFIANDKPYLCSYQGQWHAPVFKAVAVDMGLARWPADQINRRWGTLKYDWAMWPPVPYGPNQKDLYSSTSLSPLEPQRVKSWRYRHWLGTDHLGRDVLAGMIWGTRVALFMGLTATAVATLLGLLLGSLAGFFGDHAWRISRSQLLGGLLGLALGVFWGFVAGGYLLEMKGVGVYIAHGLLWLVLCAGTLGYALGRWWPGQWARQQVAIPVDSMVMRGIEIINAIPGLLLLLAIVALVRTPTLLGIALIIGLLGWTTIARFVRGELLRIRELEYVQAARVMGFRPARVLLRHALPNALGPVYVTVAFAIAGAILTESSLSFLGIGMPPEWMTWGKLLSMARTSPSAWWLAVFPGLAIFATVTVFNLLGEALGEG